MRGVVVLRMAIYGLKLLMQRECSAGMLPWIQKKESAGQHVILLHDRNTCAKHTARHSTGVCGNVSCSAVVELRLQAGWYEVASATGCTRV